MLNILSLKEFNFILENKEEIENDEIDEALFKKVKVRIRNGKVQRNKKVSAKKGFKLIGGKVKRISAKEKMNRKRAQRKGAKKRKSKLARALRKRKISLKKLKRLKPKK